MLWSIALAAPVPTVDDEAPAGTAHPGDAALVIANEDYAFLPDVPYAARDAEAVAHTLIAARGIPPERVRVLHGANREQLLEAFDAVSATVTKGTMWLYFSGHGAASPSSTEPLLVGDDAKREAAVFTARSVSVPELRQRAGARRLVVVVDACFTGAGRSGEELVPGARFVVPQWTVPEAANQLVVTAAGPDQVAGPYEAAEHGLFTWLFAGALRGWADGARDGARDGKVTVAEADTYVTRALAVLQVHDQAPVWRGGFDEVLVEGGALEVAPDLRALPRPGTGPVGPVRPEPGPAFGPVAHVRGNTWSIDGESAWGRDVKLLASRDPEGARAVGALRTLPIAQGTAGVFLTEAALVGVVMLPLSASSTFADTPEDARFYRGFGIGGLVVAGGLGVYEWWLAKRQDHHREQVAAAAERMLAAGETP